MYVLQEGSEMFVVEEGTILSAPAGGLQELALLAAEAHPYPGRCTILRHNAHPAGMADDEV